MKAKSILPHIMSSNSAARAKISIVLIAFNIAASQLYAMDQSVVSAGKQEYEIDDRSEQLAKVTNIKIKSKHWSPDSNYFIFVDSRILRIWNRNRSKIIREYGIDLDEVSDYAWSPDGKHVMVVGYNKHGKYHENFLLWYDAACIAYGYCPSYEPDSIELGNDDTHGKVRSVAWSPDSRHCAFGYDKALQIRDVQVNPVQKTLPCIINALTNRMMIYQADHDLSWSPCGNFISFCDSYRNVFSLCHVNKDDKQKIIGIRQLPLKTGEYRYYFPYWHIYWLPNNNLAGFMIRTIDQNHQAIQVKVWHPTIDTITSNPLGPLYTREIPGLIYKRSWWTPEGNLSCMFDNPQEKNKNIFFIMNPETLEPIESYSMPNIDKYAGIAWSPDQTSFIFKTDTVFLMHIQRSTRLHAMKKHYDQQALGMKKKYTLSQCQYADNHVPMLEIAEKYPDQFYKHLALRARAFKCAETSEKYDHNDAYQQYVEANNEIREKLHKSMKNCELLGMSNNNND